MRPLFFLLLFITGSFSYKFLVFNPLFAHSHTTFVSKIADTLAEAGHDVTVLMPILDETLVNKTAIKSNAKQIFIDQDPRIREIMHTAKDVMMSNMWTISPDPWSLLKMAANFSLSNGYVCEAVASSTDIIEQLRAENFDVGIAEPFTLCGFGLFDNLEIYSTIGVLSFVQHDLISWYIGEPLAPSYVPSTSSVDGDKMGFFGRMKNVFGSLMGAVFLRNNFIAEAEVLTKFFGRDYNSDFGDLLGRTSFMFTNGNPYLNYPRPLIHKTVEIGGITVDVQKVGDLGEWDKVLNERKHSVFISFGSMAKSKDMPQEWKESLISMFASLPDVTFIWKYEDPSIIADHLPNVHLSSWLPQNTLLADPRLSLFITHGGLGSTNEVACFGKPAIMIPLFADQPRNAAMLARHRGTLSLEKEDLGDTEKLREAVTRVLNDSSFAVNATRLAKILQEQPVSAKDLVISHAEFAAKFGPLKQIDPYGRKLNIVQYYLLDAMVFILVVIVVVLIVLYLITRSVLRRICKLFRSDSNISKDQLCNDKQKKFQ